MVFRAELAAALFKEAIAIFLVEYSDGEKAGSMRQLGDRSKSETRRLERILAQTTMRRNFPAH